MEPFDEIEEELQDFDAGDGSSVDDFIRQLEEREKDLDIPSDLVIEVGESEVEHDNIHDSFIAMPEILMPSPKTDTGNLERPLSTGSLNPKLPDSEELKNLKTQRDDFRDSLHRQKRDFDNYRQRTERERKDMFKNMIASLAAQMLPVLDNLNRALDANSDAGDSTESDDLSVFFEGIVLVNQQLNEVLAGMGVQPIPAVGKPFDPNIHEAVASEETDEHPPKTVIQELLRGYRVDDKVIRASMVKVSAAMSQQPSHAPKAE